MKDLFGAGMIVMTFVLAFIDADSMVIDHDMSFILVVLYNNVICALLWYIYYKIINKK